MTRSAALLIAGVLVLAGCSDAEDPPPRAASSPPSQTTSPSPPAEPAWYDVTDCPVDDGDLCDVAIDVIEALQATAPERIFALSREDRLVCAELAVEYFPACETESVLEGYAISGPTLLVEVLDASGFRRQLAAILSNVDPTFSDELGDGAPRVVGVGTCGPDVPGRRTYHLAWTAGVAEADGAAQRLLASFELTLRGGEWRIALWYLGPLGEWEVEQPDPLELAFCEAGLTPWPTV